MVGSDARLCDYYCENDVVGRQIRALVFDFDGLMVDTEGPAYESWQEIYREYDRELPLSAWAAVLGGSGAEFDPCAYLEGLIGRPFDHTAMRARRQRRKAELVAGQPLLPGVDDYISAAGRLGLKLGVASSASRAWVVGHLERCGVADRFDVIVCADDVARVKPDPALYQLAAARFDVRPAQAIALEDAPNGLLAAKRAGLFCVAVPNPLTGQLPLDGADLRLASLTDLPLDALIERIDA
jgi:HAD superfamily hydrolase (TIGR01509 family)